MNALDILVILIPILAVFLCATVCFTIACFQTKSGWTRNPEASWLYKVSLITAEHFTSCWGIVSQVVISAVPIFVLGLFSNYLYLMALLPSIWLNMTSISLGGAYWLECVDVCQGGKTFGIKAFFHSLWKAFVTEITYPC